MPNYDAHKSDALGRFDPGPGESNIGYIQPEDLKGAIDDIYKDLNGLTGATGPTGATGLRALLVLLVQLLLLKVQLFLDRLALLVRQDRLGLAALAALLGRLV